MKMASLSFLAVALGIVLVVPATQGAPALQQSWSKYPLADSVGIFRRVNKVKCSIINLIATPEKYDGKYVQIVGYLVIEFEGNSIWLSDNDYKHLIHDNAIWVEVGEDREVLKTYANQYVLLEGAFEAGNKGHLGLFAGAVKSIERIVPWKEASAKE